MRSRFAPAAALVGCILFAAWAVAQTVSPVGLVDDWSQRHVIFTNGGSARSLALAQRDPRNLQQWLRRSSYMFAYHSRASFLEPGRGDGFVHPPHWHRRTHFRTDWSVALGGSGGMPVGESPAKFTFNATAPLTTANCTNDFAVFVISANAAAGTQANIVALNNLYTGTTSSYCPNGAQTPPTTNLTGPTFMWSYAVGSGPVYFSPVLSLDGKKVAFIESPARGNPLFHVLTWVAGQGTNATTGSVAPGSGGSSVTTLSYTNTAVTGCTASPSTDSNASPFIDYTNDVAYLGDDNGRLYRITGVFNGSPTLAYCISVSPGKSLTSPVYDSVSGKVFVSDGQAVYAFTPGATSFTAAGSISIAGTANSIVLSPIVDSTNGYVYVFSNHDSTNTNSIVSQMPVSLASQVSAAIGPATTRYILDGDFDNQYFASGPTSGSLYACGTQAGASGKPALYTLSFAASGQMNTTPAMANNKNINSALNPNGYCSPMTEYFDGTTDRLFVSVTGASQLTSWNITSRITSSTALPTATALAESGGTSGISIDNNSSVPQASSIYFGTLGTSLTASCGANQYCAVKLTQSALQ